MTSETPQGMTEFLLAQIEAIKKKYVAMTDDERDQLEHDTIIDKRAAYAEVFTPNVETEVTFTYDDEFLPKS
jgi:hypothetical protein